MQHRFERRLGHLLSVEGRHFTASLTETGNSLIQITGNLSDALEACSLQEHWPANVPVTLTLKISSRPGWQETMLVAVNEPDHASIDAKEIRGRAHKALNVLSGFLQGLCFGPQIPQEALYTLKAFFDESGTLLKLVQQETFALALEAALERPEWTRAAVQTLVSDCQDCIDQLKKPYFDCQVSAQQVLMGLYAGVLECGSLSLQALRSLQKWMQQRSWVTSVWPHHQIACAFERILAQDILSIEDYAFIRAQLQEFSAFHRKDMSPQELERFQAYGPVTLFDRHAQIVCAGNHFCLTGDFIGGERQNIESEIEGDGGFVVPQVDQNTDYVVVGHFGHSCYAFCHYGHKIAQARQLQAAGQEISIISEEDFWQNAEPSLFG